MKTLKALFIIGMCVHIAHILLINSHSLFQAYQQFNHPGKQKNKHMHTSLLQNPFSHYFTLINGTQQGYHFFAPNVSSPYISRLHFSGPAADSLSTIDRPLIKQQQNLQRYSTFLDQFQSHLFPADTSRAAKTFTRYLETCFRALARHELGIRAAASSVEATLYMVHTPPLGRPAQMPSTSLTTVYRTKVK